MKQGVMSTEKPGRLKLGWKHRPLENGNESQRECNREDDIVFLGLLRVSKKREACRVHRLPL